MTPGLLEGKTVLVTGGTGSIGFHIVRRALREGAYQVRIFSRDDSKQAMAFRSLGGDGRLRMLLGDIRDRDRLKRAMEGVDVVFHCAALKHVIGCEQNPFEAVLTNVLGTQNVIDAALVAGVDRVVGISTDKAADPTSVLGCTKLLSEKLMQSAFFYKGPVRTRFCFVRFGNVIGTRGSVIPLFVRQVRSGQPLTITDGRMLRFFMSIDDAVRLIYRAFELSRDREVFILKMPVVRIGDLAQAVAEEFAPSGSAPTSEVPVHRIGRQPGERMNERLLSRDESENAVETDELFILKPFVDPEWDRAITPSDYPGARAIDMREYSTETEISRHLAIPDIRDLLRRNAHYIEDTYATTGASAVR